MCDYRKDVRTGARRASNSSSKPGVLKILSGHPLSVVNTSQSCLRSVVLIRELIDMDSYTVRQCSAS